MKGLVIKSTGTSYGVYFEDETTAECYVKGNFRIRGIRSTNPVAIGDYVEVKTEQGKPQSKKEEQTSDNGNLTNWIIDVYERRNYIVRRSTNLSYASHILAANVDMAALIVTIRQPETSTTFIDRFLATCEAYRVPACLIFNKIDLLDEAGIEELHTLRQLYESLGYPTFAISAIDFAQDTHHPLRQFFSQKVTLLSGNSGVGKSTLLNGIFGRDMARTGAISSAHHKGMHTTTFSEMYQLDTASWIIDTPGIKGFGMLDMQKEEMGHYFREIFQISRECKYSDCIHMNEPGCAVNKAVIEGKIALSRYESYLSMLDDITENKYR